MHKANVTANFDIGQILVDNVMIYVSYFLSTQMYLLITGKELFLSHLWLYLLFAVIFMLKSAGISRLVFFMFCGLSCGVVIIGRVVRRMVRSAKVGNGYTHVLFIGDNHTYHKCLAFIEKTAMKVKVDKKFPTPTLHYIPCSRSATC